MNIVGNLSENYERDVIHAPPCSVVRVDPRDNLCVLRLNALATYPAALDGKVDDTLDFSLFPVPGDTRTCHERVVHVLRIAECLKRCPDMHWKPRILRMTAIVIDALFVQAVTIPALYMKRKALNFQLPLSSKIFVDSTRNRFFLLPKKCEAEVGNDFTNGRPVFVANMVAGAAEDVLRKLWSVVPKHRGMQKRSILPNCNEDFRIEERISQRMNNASLARCFDYCFPSGKNGEIVKRLSLYERYDGDLQWLLCQDNFSRQDNLLLLRLMRKMTETLLRFHEQDLVVRDVKSQNIFVNIGEDHRGSDWKVTFYGLEHVLDQQLPPDMRPKDVKGTLFYMSPELLVNIMEHKKHYFQDQIDLFKRYCVSIDPHSDDLRPCDIYAMGLVCYQLVFNQAAPWKVETISKIIEAQLFLPLIEKPSDLTEENVHLFLQYIVLQMMHPKMEDRPTIRTVVAFLQDLEEEIYSKGLLHTMREPK